MNSQETSASYSEYFGAIDYIITTPYCIPHQVSTRFSLAFSSTGPEYGTRDDQLPW